MFNFGMFKGEKPNGGLVKEAMNTKSKEEQIAAQEKIEGLAFQKALIEVMDSLSEEELDQMEADSKSMSKEDFAAQAREKFPNFASRMAEIKNELNSELEKSLEETDGIDVNMAGKVGELAFTRTMNEIIAEADNEVIDSLNDIMNSDASLEEKLTKVEEIIPDFQEILEKNSNQTAEDIKTLAEQTREKVEKLKKERGIE